MCGESMLELRQGWWGLPRSCAARGGEAARPLVSRRTKAGWQTTKNWTKGGGVFARALPWDLARLLREHGRGRGVSWSWWFCVRGVVDYLGCCWFCSRHVFFSAKRIIAWALGGVRRLRFKQQSTTRTLPTVVRYMCTSTIIGINAHLNHLWQTLLFEISNIKSRELRT